MQAFDVAADPVRRRILQLLAANDSSSGEVVTVIQRKFGVTQAAVSQHLKVLRDSGFATPSFGALALAVAVNAGHGWEMSIMGICQASHRAGARVSRIPNTLSMVRPKQGS